MPPRIKRNFMVKCHGLSFSVSHCHYVYFLDFIPQLCYLNCGNIVTNLRIEIIKNDFGLNHRGQASSLSKFKVYIVKQNISCRLYSYPKYAVRNCILFLFTFIENQKFLIFYHYFFTNIETININKVKYIFH